MWRRRAFNLSAVLSMILCAALLVLGARNRDEFVFAAGGRLYWIMVGGSVEVLTVSGWPPGEHARWITLSPGGHEPLVSIEGGPSVRQWLGVTVESTPVASARQAREGPRPDLA